MSRLLRGLMLAMAVAMVSTGVARSESFTVVVMPDTQAYTGYAENQPLFAQQARWVAENIESRNIVFLTHLGDITGRMPDALPPEEQWPFADSAMSELDGKIPYSAVFGNHDHDQFPPPRSGATTNTAELWFGASRYEDYDWFVGASPDGASFSQVFKLGDVEVLHIGLRFRPGAADFEWARAVLASHPGKPTIISTHAYLQDAGRSRREGVVEAGRDSNGEALWNDFVRHHDQVFMVISGHNHAGEDVQVSGEYNEDGEYHQESVNLAGRQVWEFLADYQDYPNGGDGWLQLFEFDLEAGQLRVSTYSPFLDAWQEDAQSQFTIPIDFERRLRPASG